MVAATGAAATPEAAGGPVFDAAEVESRVERSLVKRVRKLVDDFPERSLDVVRVWMADDR